ncbi:phosphoserine phosphatase SerB [Aquibaculum sediminis]|uniref:phosphoserine phosphatase SerB n=1 Tax=Aquibaculum sediminis TaxID=3231907 RepID=UPI0034546F10
MTQVLTVIDDPQRAELSAAHMESLRAALAMAGATPGEAAWLWEGVACDLPFTPGPDHVDLEAQLRAVLGDAPLDLAIQPAAGRRKALLVADLESTIIAQEMLDELGELVGKRDEIAEVTARSMRGELGFEEALNARVALLADLPERVLSDTAARMSVNPGAAGLVATLRRHGVRCALVSGGFTCFAEPIAERLGFEVVRANRLEVSEGRLSGRVVPPILGREAKLETLQELCRERGITPAEAAAVGDGANDLAMLEAAGLGVAYRGKPLVRERARFRLDHADLTGLLFLQGYRREEIVPG